MEKREFTLAVLEKVAVMSQKTMRGYVDKKLKKETGDNLDPQLAKLKT